MKKDVSKNSEHPTNKLAALAESLQAKFGLNQNIATNPFCNGCILVDLCTRGDSGGECRREQTKTEYEN